MPVPATTGIGKCPFRFTVERVQQHVVYPDLTHDPGDSILAKVIVSLHEAATREAAVTGMI